jgi:hypothetical protein
VTFDWCVVQAPSLPGSHWLHPASRSRGKPTTTSSVESRRAAILGAATRHFKRGMCRRSRGCRAVHRRGTPRGRFGAAEGPSLTVSRDRCQAGRGQELTPAKVGFGDYWKQSTWPPSALPDREAALGPRLSTVARCTSLSALPRWPVPAYRQVKVAPECQHEHRRVLPCHGQLLCLRIEGQRRYWPPMRASGTGADAAGTPTVSAGPSVALLSIQPPAASNNTTAATTHAARPRFAKEISFNAMARISFRFV